jgi:hypothetical protein
MALASGQINLKIDTDSPSADGVNALERVGSYGDNMVLQGQIAPDVQALQASKYQALTAPAVTPVGVAMGIQVAFSDTANIAFIIVNGASAGGKRIIMDYILVRITAAGTTTTSSEAAFEVDPSNRYSSGGTSLTVANVTTDSTQASVTSQVRHGAITAAAAGGSRKWLWQRIIRRAAAPVWIVNDQVHFSFGSPGAYIHGANVISSTDANGTAYTWPVPPAVIGPGGSGLLHIANVANATTPPSISVEAGWYEY